MAGGGFLRDFEPFRTAPGPGRGDGVFARPRRCDGVSATSRHRDAIDATARESTDRVERPRCSAQARGVLETMIQLIDDQRDAWAVAEDVAGFIGTSQAMLWRELVIEDIEDGSKARSRRFDVLWWFHFVDETRI